MLGLEKAIVKADDIHMNSIFSNLILNAKDALEESEYDRQKEIGITVDKDMAHEGFVVNISDNGPGIMEENLYEIFEPFYSTKPTTGTGLGLGVVKRLIRREVDHIIPIPIAFVWLEQLATDTHRF